MDGHTMTQRERTERLPNGNNKRLMSKHPGGGRAPLAWTLALLALLLAASGPVRVAGAQGMNDWELTGLTEPVLRLFTPSSGAFFAQTGHAFLRSDDAGTTWRHVSLDPA